MRAFLAFVLVAFAAGPAAAGDLSSTLQLHDLTRDGAFVGCHVVTESFTTYRLTVNQGDRVTFSVVAPANNTNVHTLAIEGGPTSDQVAPDGSATLTYVANRPGNVALLCDGKQDALSGGITVRPASVAEEPKESPPVGLVGTVLAFALVAYRRRA